MKTGQVLFSQGLITKENLDDVLAVQARSKDGVTSKPSPLFGTVLCDLGLVTPVDIYCALHATGKLMDLEACLVTRKLLSRKQLDDLVERATQKGLPLISLILEEKVVDKSRLQTILFDLFHIPLRSVSSMVFDPARGKTLSDLIGAATAQKEGAIPLKLEGHTLVVGIIDPSSLLFVKKLDQTLPQYRITPVFISFSGFDWFYKLLYQGDREFSAPVSLNGTPPEKEAVQGKTAFSVILADPFAQVDKIISLYGEYEALARIQPSEAPEDMDKRKNQFIAFIRHYHGQIARYFNCQKVVFSVKPPARTGADTYQPKVLAVPITREATPWQK